MSARSQAADRLDGPSSIGRGLLQGAVAAARARRADTGLIQTYVHSECCAADSAPTELQISRTWPDRHTILVTAVGEVDISTSGQLRAAIASALAERPARLIVDLAGVPFADSQLVHVLQEVCAEQTSERVVDVRVARARSHIVRLLAVCDLAHLCVERG